MQLVTLLFNVLNQLQKHDRFLNQFFSQYVTINNAFKNKKGISIFFIFVRLLLAQHYIPRESFVLAQLRPLKALCLWNQRCPF